MEPEDKFLLTENIDLLMKTKNIDSLVDELLNRKVLTPYIVDQLHMISTDENKRRALFDEIKSRGPSALEHLLSALAFTDNEHISRTLNHIKYGPNYQYFKIKVIDSKKPLDVNDDSSMPAAKIYRMRSAPKGFALIININRFFELGRTQLADDTRHGSYRDVANLYTLLDQLGYAVAMFYDLTKQEIIDKVSNFAGMPEHASVDSTIMVVMSHGGEMQNTFRSYDNQQVHCDRDIVAQFKCNHLKGKPKIFIFQMCRGDVQDHGTDSEYVDTTNDVSTASTDSKLSNQPVDEPQSTGGRRLVADREPLINNIFQIYSTTFDHESIRDPVQGGYFVQNMCMVFAERAHELELRDLVHETTQRITAIYDRVHGFMTPTFTCSADCGKFYFNPGVYDVEVSVGNNNSSFSSSSGVKNYRTTHNVNISHCDGNTDNNGTCIGYLDNAFSNNSNRFSSIVNNSDRFSSIGSNSDRFSNIGNDSDRFSNIGNISNIDVDYDNNCSNYCKNSNNYDNNSVERGAANNSDKTFKIDQNINIDSNNGDNGNNIVDNGFGSFYENIDKSSNIAGNSIVDGSIVSSSVENSIIDNRDSRIVDSIVVENSNYDNKNGSIVGNVVNSNVDVTIDNKTFDNIGMNVEFVFSSRGNRLANRSDKSSLDDIQTYRNHSKISCLINSGEENLVNHQNNVDLDKTDSFTTINHEQKCAIINSSSRNSGNFEQKRPDYQINDAVGNNYCKFSTKNIQENSGANMNYCTNNINSHVVESFDSQLCCRNDVDFQKDSANVKSDTIFDQEKLLASQINVGSHVECVVGNPGNMVANLESSDCCVGSEVTGRIDEINSSSLNFSDNILEKSCSLTNCSIDISRSLHGGENVLKNSFVKPATISLASNQIPPGSSPATGDSFKNSSSATHSKTLSKNKELVKIVGEISETTCNNDFEHSLVSENEIDHQGTSVIENSSQTNYTSSDVPYEKSGEQCTVQNYENTEINDEIDFSVAKKHSGSRKYFRKTERKRSGGNVESDDRKTKCFDKNLCVLY